MSIQLIGPELIPSLERVSREKAVSFSKLMMIVAQMALKALVEGNLAAFDAPVGDNSCKIRGSKITDIAMRFLKETTFACETIDLMQKIASGKINLRLSHDHAFLIQTFLLTIAKRYPETLAVNGISKGNLKDWIHHTKVCVAKESVRFVQEEVTKFPLPRREILEKMLTFVKVYEKRPVLPNFHSMEVLFKRALENGRQIVFFSVSQKLLLHPNSTKTNFIPKEVEEENLQLPAIAIIAEGKIDTNDILGELLTRASQDPQYLEGAKSEDLSVQEELFEKHRTLSVHFRINHILCERIGSFFTIQTTVCYTKCNWMGDDCGLPLEESHLVWRQ